MSIPIKGNIVITGGSGVGKTKLAKSLLIQAHQSGATTVLLTPTDGAKSEYDLFRHYINRHATGSEEIAKEIRRLFEVMNERTEQISDDAAEVEPTKFSEIIVFVDEAGYVLRDLTDESRDDLLELSYSGVSVNISIVMVGQNLYERPEVAQGRIAHNVRIDLDKGTIAYHPLSVLIADVDKIPNVRLS